MLNRKYITKIGHSSPERNELSSSRVFNTNDKVMLKLRFKRITLPDRETQIYGIHECKQLK